MTKGLTIHELARKLGVVLPNYIVKINNKLVPENEEIANGDSVHFMKVVSGG